MSDGALGGIAAGKVGIGANFAKSRLMLAKRAGYLPQEFQMQPNQAPEQWRAASTNLARDSRAAGFANPMQFLRQGATQGGKIPKATAYRPGAGNDPASALAYANSRIAQLQRSNMGGQVGQALQGSQGTPGRDPRELWRMLSGLLASQAKSAGHLDPRRYLAQMGGGQRLPQLPRLANPQQAQGMRAWGPQLPQVGNMRGGGGQQRMM